MSNTDKINIGLHKQDKLSVIEIGNGLNLDCLRKDVIGIFHNKRLKITVDTNLSTTVILDVTLDPFHGKYYAYRKPDNRPRNENANSNNPKTILKQLPTMVNKRLSSLSIDEDEFDKTKLLSLTFFRFNKNLKFETIQTTPLQNRSSKLLWFDSYVAEVKKNIGKVFLNLVRKYFYKQYF